VFKIVPSTTSHKTEPLLPTLEAFRRLGFAEIDLNLHHLREESVSVDDVLRAIDDGGPAIAIASGGWCDFYHQGRELDATMASVERQIALTRALGVSRLRLFYGRLPRRDYAFSTRNTIVGNLRRLADAHRDMLFVFENHDGASLDPEVCAEVLGVTDRPNVRANFDPINFERSGVDAMDALRVLRPFVEHVHLKGAANGENCEFGAGDVDLTPVLRSLLESGYRGDFTVEYEGPFDRTLRLFVAHRRAVEAVASIASETPSR
jgi:sugar phosphate isomerase/epimerase